MGVVSLAVVYAALQAVPVASTSVVCCTPAVVYGKAGRYLRSQILMNSVPIGGDECDVDGNASHQHLGDTWNPWKVDGQWESVGNVLGSMRMGVRWGQGQPSC